MTVLMSTFEEITAIEERYQLATYKKMPIVAERGEGVWIYTSDGQRYLDLYGGHAVGGTGHCHPHVVTAIDNLVKGAAGQAVQNMNLMFGLDEKTGLILTGTNP